MSIDLSFCKPEVFMECSGQKIYYVFPDGLNLHPCDLVFSTNQYDLRNPEFHIHLDPYHQCDDLLSEGRLISMDPATVSILLQRLMEEWKIDYEDFVESMWYWESLQQNLPPDYKTSPEKQYNLLKQLQVKIVNIILEKGLYRKCDETYEGEGVPPELDALRLEKEEMTQDIRSCLNFIDKYQVDKFSPKDLKVFEILKVKYLLP